MRVMTKADIPGGMRLKEIAGWNQTTEDWNRFLDASPEGCFVADIDGDIRGTVATMVYEDRFAWISMVLVDPAYRGQGWGRKLLRRAIEYLQNAKIPCIKLDATALGKPLYEKIGFQTEYEIERHTRTKAEGREPAVEDRLSPGAVSAEGLQMILAGDREVFGADRGQLLRAMWHEAPELAGAVWDGPTLRGSMFARHGSFADHLGPWMSKDREAASALLNSFIARSNRETVLVDVLKSNSMATGLLKSAGFQYARPLTRMFLGVNQQSGKMENLCAITGPEFG